MATIVVCMSSRTINRLSVAVLGLVLASCSGLPTSTPTSSPPPGDEGRVTTTTVAENPATRVVEGAIGVVLRLPSDWGEAVVWGRSDEYPTARLAWESSGASLDVSLPGEGAYRFWAEAPSSDDGLCFYQAQSEQTDAFDGDTVKLDFAGEMCE